ncbi:MAG: hypothetical protein AB7V50_09240 [Vampirovibrionia bacterium]
MELNGNYGNMSGYDTGSTPAKKNGFYGSTNPLLDQNGNVVSLSKTGNPESDTFQNLNSTKPEKKGIMDKIGSFFDENPHAQGCIEMLAGGGALAAALSFSLPFGLGAIAFLAGGYLFGAGVMDFDNATDKQQNAKKN